MPKTTVFQTVDFHLLHYKSSEEVRSKIKICS
jgi:hypothetical protein